MAQREGGGVPGTVDCVQSEMGCDGSRLYCSLNRTNLANVCISWCETEKKNTKTSSLNFTTSFQQKACRDI